MPIDRANDARDFRDFLDARLSSEPENRSLEELLDLWEHENQSERERAETLQATREGRADVDAGRARRAREALAEIRRKHNLPELP